MRSTALQSIELTPEEHARQMQAWSTGDQALADMANALQEAQIAKTTRALARARVKMQSNLIGNMLDQGLGWAFILVQLEKSMPQIPRNDVFKALESLRLRILRGRQKEERAQFSEGDLKMKHSDPSSILAKQTSQTSESASLIQDITQNDLSITPEKGNPITHPQEIKANKTDRQPSESDVDYALRKSLEPDPRDRLKFIGEH